MKKKIVISSILVGAVAFALGHVIWPPSGDLTPTAGQLPFFIFVSASEAIGFGAALTFLFFAGIPFIKKTTEHKTLALWTILALTWMVGSWWSHTNWHIMIEHGDTQALLYIELAYHASSVIAGMIVLYGMYQLLLKPKLQS